MAALKKQPRARAWTYPDGVTVHRTDGPAGKSVWQSGGTSRGGPRPLLYLDRIQATPALPVLVVEGELKADFAQAALGGSWCVTTWRGGAKQPSKTDFGPLLGRNVTLWADADSAGREAMAYVACVLPGCRMVHVDPDLDDKSDCADVFPEEIRNRVSEATVPPAPLCDRPRVTVEGGGGKISTGNRSAALAAIAGAARKFGAGAACLGALGMFVDQELFDTPMEPGKAVADARGMVRYSPAVRPLPEIVRFGDVRGHLPALAPEIIEGVLRRGHKAVLGGPSKSGKSFSMISLGRAISTGGCWFGHQCIKGKALYVNLEIDGTSFFHRVAAVDIDSRADFDILNLRGHDITPERLIEAVGDRRYDLLIVDPAYKLYDMSTDFGENDAISLMRLFRGIDLIAEHTGAAVMIAAHFSKGAQGGRAAVDRISGSGVYGRDPDAILTLTELDGIDGGYRLEYVLREFPSPAATAWRFIFPAHVRDTALDSIGLKGEGKRRGLHAPDVVDAWKSEADESGFASIDAIRRALGKGSHSTFFRLVKGLDISGKNENKLKVDRHGIRGVFHVSSVS